MGTEPLVNWQCPVCMESVEAVSRESLFWAVREHIQEHLTRAAYDAVLRAAMDCQTSYCKIGQGGQVDRAGLPVLTSFDRLLFRSLNVRWEDPT